MVLLGAIVNALAIIAGGALGLVLKKGLPERVSDALMKGNGLVVLYIGISGSLKGQNLLIAVLSVAIGGMLGAWIDIDKGLNLLGEDVQKLFVKGEKATHSTFAEGFVTATLLFCIGAMAIVGSLQSGMNLDHSVIYSKSVIDGLTAMIFAASLGAGVLLSSVPVFLYQGGIALLAAALATVLSETVIAELTCTGSIIIMALGLNMLGLTKIKVADFLPALFIPIGLVPLFNLFG